MGHINGDTTKVIGAGASAVLQNSFDARTESLRIRGGAASLAFGSEHVFSFGSNILVWKLIANRNGAISAAHCAFAGQGFSSVAEERNFFSHTERVIDCRYSVAAGVKCGAIFQSGGHGRQSRGGFDAHGFLIDERDSAHIQVKD